MSELNEVEKLLVEFSEVQSKIVKEVNFSKRGVTKSSLQKERAILKKLSKHLDSEIDIEKIVSRG